MGKYAKNRNDVSRDTLYEEAIQLLKEQGKISTSLLQRQLYIGYSIASDIFDRMEREGLVKRQGCAGILDDGEAFFVK
jgi:S-DNA-T family DNA segregation ATPase FtsK/SpoIIIE